MSENKNIDKGETLVQAKKEPEIQTSSPKSTRQKLILWGIPTFVILVLIILLAIEVVEEEEIPQDALVSDQRTVTMLEEGSEEQHEETEDKNEDDHLSENDNTDFQQDSSQGQATGFIAKKANEVELVNLGPDDVSWDVPLIIEEDNFRWKLASNNDSIEDEWKWKTILIQNRAKINYTIFSDETNQWKINIDSGQRLIYSPGKTKKSVMSFDRSRKKRFALQLISMDSSQLQKAIETVRFLVKDGYFAYVYRTEEKIRTSASKKPQFFYRVRVGFYERENEAIAAGEEIFERYQSKRLFPEDFWAVLPSFRELNGELIDFGIQRSKPWIIQLAINENRSMALNNLRSITSTVDFSYLSTRKHSDGGIIYRTRVGFFETEKESRIILSRIQAKNPGTFNKASLIKLKRIIESSPGQSTSDVVK